MSGRFKLRLRFRPRLLDCLPGYNRADFGADLAAGISVALVALPLAIAFGIASGVRPEQGIVTAIVGGLIVSLLGGSRVQIAGPAGAFVALLYAIVEKYGVANLLIATMMAGVLLFAMGALRLGTLVRFIPVAIVTGFTTGIAAIIALSQVRDLFGLAIDRMPSNFLSQVAALAGAIHSVNWFAVGIGAASMVAIRVWPTPQAAPAGSWRYVTAKLPATVVVIVASALAAWAFSLPVETIGSRFGALPRSIPMPTLPAFDWATAQNLVAPTVSIALLGAIESLLCARMADGLIGDRHDPNQELMAQGIANFAAPLFGGIAVTGTIARTMTNVKTGGRTPVSGIVHAAALLLVVLALAPLASWVPLSALAAVLVWVAWNMVPWRELKELPRYSMFYRAILLATLALTVVFDLTVAVEMGLVLSSLFFIYRIAEVTRVDPVDLAPAPPGAPAVGAWRVFGSLFFGSVTKVERLLDPACALPQIVILDMDRVINIDTTGLDALQALHEAQARRGGRLVLSGLNEQPRSLIARSGFLQVLGADGVFEDLEAAIAATR